MSIKIMGTIRASLALLSALLCWPAVAATYYVDFVNGSDANAGTSTSAPWQHCPGDPKATGVVPSTVPPNSLVLFNGGITYTLAAGEYINVPAASSGTGNNYTIYRSGDRANPQWGTTPAFINGSSATTAIGLITLATAVNNVMVDGLALANQTNNNDYGALIATSGTSGGNIIIQNCILTNGAGCGIYIQGGNGNGPPNPTSFCVSNCLIQYFNYHGIFFRYGIDQAAITNCSIHFSGSPIYPGTYAGDNICLYCGTLSQMHNIYIDGNDLGTTPTKGCLLAETPVTGLYLRGNYCHGTNNAAAWIFNGYLTNIVCYNNVYNITIYPGDGIYRFETDWGANQVNGFQVYNDTVVSSLANGAIFNFSKGNSTSNTMFYNVDIRNCIINDTGYNEGCIMIAKNAAGTGLVLDTNTFTCDYNVWNGFCNQNRYFSWGLTNDVCNFPKWQAFTGQDVHSSTNIPSYVSSAGGDWHLAGSDKVALRRGSNLSGYLQADKDGIVRPPPAGSWCIGAYEYSIPAPTGLRVIGSP